MRVFPYNPEYIASGWRMDRQRATDLCASSRQLRARAAEQVATAVRLRGRCRRLCNETAEMLRAFPEPAL